MDISQHFEAELRQRDFPFSIEAASNRYAIQIDGGSMLVSLENLQRDVASDGDLGRVKRFVDAIVASVQEPETAELSANQLYWSLEPNDYEEPASYKTAISNCVDRVLVYLSNDGRLVTWVTPGILNSLGLSELEAGSIAFSNLERALRESTIEAQDIDGVQLGFINTQLPFKASLMLAPNLREVVGSIIGWPLMAVAPDRDFLYLWAAQHSEFAQRVGGVVVREYSQSSYQISTEVYEITDKKIKAIGEFPKKIA